MFQIRQKQPVKCIQGNTLHTSLWPQDLQLDPEFSNDELEWVITTVLLIPEVSDKVEETVPFGLLVRVSKEDPMKTFEKFRSERLSPTITPIRSIHVTNKHFNSDIENLKTKKIFILWVRSLVLTESCRSMTSRRTIPKSWS